MNPLRPLVVLLLILAVVAAACTGADDDEVVATPSPTLVPLPTPPPPPPEPTETEDPDVFPLTGLAVDGDDDRLDLPALGIKVDNAPAARPQVGLADADIVFEELVEGGVTRFLAVYHSTDPDEVGPVRSGREVDADLFPPFGGILAISGAAAPTYNVLFSAGLTVFEEGQAGGAIYRVEDRASPHNLNAIATRLWDTGSSQPAAEEPWPFDAQTPPGGEEVIAVVAAFSEESTHSWAWREDDGVFERGQNGTRHLTEDGTQVSAANVVYATVGVSGGGGVDVQGSATVEITLIGEGPATFLRDGRVFEGRWRKTSREAQFEWLDERGRIFPLAPGRTWVELQPVGFDVDTDPDQDDVDADAPTEEPTE